MTDRGRRGRLLRALTMVPELTCEEFSAALDAVAWDTLCAGGVTGPPVDGMALAQRLGLLIAWDDSQAGRARLVRLGGSRGAAQGAILIRRQPRPEREQWSVAHEIGERVAHEVFARLGTDPRCAAPGSREQVANALAGRLLLPAPWFAESAAACQWDLAELKRIFPTASHELIARRMLDFAPPVIISVYDQGELRFRRSNVPGRAPPPGAEEQRCQRMAHEVNEPQTWRGESHSVRAWPIHEANWRREILRAELHDTALV